MITIININTRNNTFSPFLQVITVRYLFGKLLLAYPEMRIKQGIPWQALMNSEQVNMRFKITKTKTENVSNNSAIAKLG